MHNFNFIKKFFSQDKSYTKKASIPQINRPYHLPDTMDEFEVKKFQDQLTQIENLSQYGWGHTIDFGKFVKTGILGEEWKKIPACLDDWEWWPNLTGLSIADVGCYSGAISLIMANRKPKIVYAVDEIPEHLMQAKHAFDAFGVNNVVAVNRSVYQLTKDISLGSLDLILLSGVLYHLSDMLLGLYVLQQLLKPRGILLIELNAIDDEKESYANFGRYHAGMWWQPSSLCIRDMCEFMGFGETELRFYRKNRCLVRTTKISMNEIPFKRGINWDFTSLVDDMPRIVDAKIMAPKT